MRSSLLAALIILSACTEQGPKGENGAAGPAGPAGPQGPQGIQGERGPQGEQGPAGAMGATGAEGAQGPQGIQGPAGAVLVIDGGVVVGPPGSSVVVTPITAGSTCPNGGVRITQLSDGGISNVCNGEQGPQGLQGSQGAPGAIGPQGAAGAGVSMTVLAPMSTQCPTGGVLLSLPDGGTSAVCNGAQGAQGAQGIQGIQGAAGAPGTSVTVTVLAAGDANCPYGGARFTLGTANSYACNGAPGPMGPPGGTVTSDGGTVGGGAAQAGNEGYAFAGFTTTPFTGNLGGIQGAHAKCSAEYPGSHLCTSREYEVIASAAPVPAAGAWIDGARYISTSTPSATPRDRDTSYTCNSWRAASGEYSGSLLPTGEYSATSVTTSCGTSRPLACCRSPHAAWFRGFTTLTFNGNLGGIQGAHAKCAAQYAGSHFCTSREYEQAGSAAPVPASGAWIDGSRYISSSTPSATPRDRDTSYTCNSWRASSGEYSGSLLATGEYSATSVTTSCGLVRPLACCSN